MAVFETDLLPTARLGDKLAEINWGLIFFVTLIAGVGFVMLYSAARGFDPWADRQMARYFFGLVLLLVIAIIDVRVWMKIAYPAYAIALLLLIAVFLFGRVGMGAQRWLDFGVIQIQPSEVMKIALILALARYFHSRTIDQIANPLHLVPPLLIILVPVGLVMEQPDLGTSFLLLGIGAALVFLAGLKWRYILLAVAGTAGAAYVGWNFLRDYQRQRVLTFLDPESDPLGTGYNILQAKIALGSGGVWGKGFMNGTQSHLNFLPEHQTDFIFTMLAEEWGLMGALGLLGLYLIVLAYGLQIALASRNHFGRLVAMGVSINFLLYIVINVAMVTGLIPVVGVPLPLVSYGGTAMITIMIGFGLLMSVHVHRMVEVPRKAGALW